MRGIRVTKESRKIDVVLVAARYTSKGDRVRVAKGYVRRGPIWGDLMLLPRKDLVERLKSGERIVVGEHAEVPGSFHTVAKVRLDEGRGGEKLVADGKDGVGDELGLPLY
ncbi:MAG: hypothetical protein E3J30_02520 [Anaerolineales bacterium]|nr:MAG: hypothetical protein E3J30_02520 [Anaerolineales bacterium]